MSDPRSSHQSLPLAGCRVIERSRTVAGAYAGRLLAAMGAEVTLAEPPKGSALRSWPPLVQDGESALFTHLSVGKRSLVCDLGSDLGRQAFERELALADILIDDTPLSERAEQGLTEEQVASFAPLLVHVSVRPFGAYGPKADWVGEELNVMHSSGEGFLLPNGLSNTLFPDRPPLKIYGHFAGYQGGAAAALAALSAWWTVDDTGGQYVDVSVQDAMLLCGSFALQRLGDGSLEHRETRRFRYGGVFEASDGFVGLLMLEDRQWAALVKLLGSPLWAQDKAFNDPIERSNRGEEINRHIATWMAKHTVRFIAERAQELGVPAAPYRTPDDVLGGDHEHCRSLFAPVPNAAEPSTQAVVAPFQFRESPLGLERGVPSLGERHSLLESEAAR